MKVVAVIPCFNESRHIGQVTITAKKYVDIVLVTDDRSRDNTLEVARRVGAQTISNKQGFRGYGANIWNGIRYARHHLKADTVVVLDGDGQHDANEIPLLLAPIVEGRADIVMGCRTNGHNMPAYRRFGNRVLSLACNVGAQQVIPDAATGFWAMKVRAIPDLTERGWGIMLELLIKSRKYTRFVFVPVSVRYRGLSEDSSDNALHQGWSNLMSILKWRLKVEVLN